MERVPECYNCDLMDPLLDGFKAFLDFPDASNSTILRFFMKESAQKPTIWTLLQSYFKELIDADIYWPIFSAILGVLNYPDEFDLKRFSDVLEEIKTETSGGKIINLKQLFLAFYHGYLNALKKHGYNCCSEIDPFFEAHSDAADYDYFPQLILCIAAEVQYRILYGIAVDIEAKLLSADEESELFVDEVVTAAVCRRQGRYHAKLERNRNANRKRDEKEKARNGNAKEQHFIRYPISEIEEKSKDSCFPVPGALLPLFQLAEIRGLNDLAGYLLQAHILKAFQAVNWRSSHNPKTRMMEILFVHYAFFIRSLFSKSDPMLRRTKLDQYYSQDKFKADVLSPTFPSLFDIQRQLLHKRQELCVSLMDIIIRGRHLLAQAMPRDLYSFYNLYVPLSLYCIGDLQRAGEYLTRYYYEVSDAHRQCFCFQVLTYKCILKSQNAQIANTLLGYCANDTAKDTRDQEWLINEVQAMLNFIDRVERWLLERNEYTIFSNESFHDIVFLSKNQEYGITLKNLIVLIESECEQHKVPWKRTFDLLMHAIEGLSYYPGIRLSSLNISPRDGYDKLKGALSSELCAEGNGFFEKSDEYELFYQSHEMNQVRLQIEDIAQHHIRLLVDEKIDDAIARILELRAEALSSQESDILEQIENAVNDLSIVQLTNRDGVHLIEQDILRMHDSFLRNFNLPHESLFERIEDYNARQDIRNYLTTSEFVYRVLASRTPTDRTVLDYSPALIALTKAIERILNYYYCKLQMPENLDCVQGLTSSDRGELKRFKYYKRNDLQTSVDLGSAINAISNLHESEGNGFDVYKRFGGESVLDIRKLSLFSSAQLKGLSRTQDSGETTDQYTDISLHFSQDSDANRRTLAQALDYIRHNYRNRVAHKNPVERTTFEECKEMLLQSENLIWILLYLFKT